LKKSRKESKSVNNKDFEFLEKIVGKDNIFSGANVSEDYHKDELKTIIKAPHCVLKVESAKDISKIMTYANEKKIPVTVRGSGTGLVGSCVAVSGGIMLDMTKMDKIIELDEKNMTLTLEPGVLLMNIYEYVEPKGFFYAPDPGEKSATIGGNISTNAGGMRAVKYGVTRDWIMGLEVVLASGEIINVGGKVQKDSSGYSLKHLFIGSEGTLGIITKVIVKLLPLPKESLSILMPFPSAKEAIAAVPKIKQSKIIPCAIEFFEKGTLIFAEEYLGKKFPDKNNTSYILLTFDGNSREQVESDYKKVADLALTDLKALDALIVDTKERKDAVWQTRGSFLEAIKSSTTNIDECDVVVPVSEIDSYLRFTYDLAKKHKIRIPSFGHAGDGNLHIYLCQDEMSAEEFSKRLDIVFDLMYQKAFEVGGLVSGEHGIGYAKKKYLLEQVGPTQIAIMQGIKKSFDPNNILNPGKICQ